MVSQHLVHHRYPHRPPVRVTALPAVRQGSLTTESAKTKVESAVSETDMLPTNDFIIPMFSDSCFTTVLSVSDRNSGLMVMDA